MTWKFERVAGPYSGPLGGLAWDGAGMLFSAVMENVIYRYDPARGKVSVARKYTNRTNGLAFAHDGVLYGCQEGSRRVVRYEKDGSATLTTSFLGRQMHNHPCDLAVDRRGRVWFADPFHALPTSGPQIFGQLDHASVLRLEQDPAPQRRHWTLERMTFDTTNPRAVALSPDEKTLYVAENNLTPGGARELRAYPVRADGTLDHAIAMQTFGADHRGPHRGIEGLCIDAQGNVVAVGGWRRSGPGPLVSVFTPGGVIVESHPLPGDLPVNCAFGDRDLTSLYFTTADGTLYRARRTGRRGFALPAACGASRR